MDAFKAATGYEGLTGSTLLMLVDNAGNWGYVKIPAGGYVGSDCGDVNGKNLNIQVDTTGGAFAPPNGQPGLSDPVFLVAGLQVISFRVLTDSVDGIPKLQQKLGLFDPVADVADNVASGFTNVMENVEDLQVAYMYPDGAIWNTVNQTLGGAHVPIQTGPTGVAPALDIQNVIGVRFSITGRSPFLPLGARKLTNVDAHDPLDLVDQTKTPNQHFRPGSEDHAVTMDTVNGHPTWPVYDQFDHYRSTATLMLRNRIPRG